MPRTYLCEDSSDSACLSSVGDLPGESLTSVDEKISGVYQDWVHQNPGTHLGDGI